MAVNPMKKCSTRKCGILFCFLAAITLYFTYVRFNDMIWKVQVAEKNDFTDHQYGKMIMTNHRYSTRILSDTQTCIPLLKDVLPLFKSSSIPIKPWQPVRNNGNLGVTSAKTTSFIISNNQRAFNVGDIVHLQITAKDIHGRPRPSGGDFWFAVLNNNDSSTAGKIVDYYNGTYSVYFYTCSPGRFNISIVLVHSSKAVRFLRDNMWTQMRAYWSGVYESADGLTVNTTCELQLGSEAMWNNKCEYSDNNALGNVVFLCTKKPNLACDTLKYIIIDKPSKGRILQTISDILGDNIKLFQGQNALYQPLALGPTHILIKGRNNKQKIDLQTCKPSLQQTLSDGYWRKDQWRSFHCNNVYMDKNAVGRCLTDRTVYFLGDSTLFQWFASFKEKLGAVGPPYNCVGASSNTSLKFIFHMLTLHANPLPWNTSPQYSYEVNKIDEILQGDCNFVVTLGPAYHFVQWSRDAFIERLRHLRAALFRLHDSCPNVPIIIKTPHPYYEKGRPELISISTSDYIVFEMRKIILKMFDNMDVFVIDAWDMNLAFPAPNIIHMPPKAVEAEISMLLSYICKNN